ncbi:MAG: glycosyltransferase family 9 protein [Planctomycetota bacterium]
MNPGGADSAQRRILAVHPGALGDVVLFGHLLGELDGEVTLVAGGEKARLLAGLGVCARALDFDALPMHELMGDAPPDGCRLPALLGEHDRVVSCFGGDGLRLAAMCGASDAVVLPVRPPPDANGHLLDLWADLLGLSAVRVDEPWPVPPSWPQGAREALQAAGVDADHPYVAVHPGAGAPAKCWPGENFTRLAQGPPGDTQAVVILGPVEAERGPAASAFEPAAVLQSPSLDVLAGVLGGAAGYVGNDSGVSHLAAAVGAPTVALFGATRAEQFAPRGPRVRTLQVAALANLPVGQVSAALAEVMSSSGA